MAYSMPRVVGFSTSCISIVPHVLPSHDCPSLHSDAQENLWQDTGEVAATDPLDSYFPVSGSGFILYQ